MEKWIHRILWWSVGMAVVAAYGRWGYALVVGLGGAFFLGYTMWRAYWDRDSVIARQAILMNWIYSGTLKNSTGTHDLCVRRGGIEARILHDGGVAITDVATIRHFIDFVEVERWLATEASSKPLAPHPPTPPKKPTQTQPKHLPPELARP